MPARLAMVNTYRPALQCEAVREAVFAGKTTPHVFRPAHGMGGATGRRRCSADAPGPAGTGRAGACDALEQAPASSGQLNGVAFEWIADADSRLGPVLEVIINGRYGWLPFMHLSALTIEPVADLRDLVWAPAHITFANGGDTVALLPVRYAGSADSGDAALQLARRTDWLSSGRRSVQRPRPALAHDRLGRNGPARGARDRFRRRHRCNARGRRLGRTMAAPDLRDRLQPALLDRLIDDAPAERKESEEKRVMSKAQLRQAVLA